jgi:hypothetical protein
MVLGLVACAGDGGEGAATTTATARATVTTTARATATATPAPTLSAEEAKELAAIPDPEKPDESMAEVVSQKDLSAADVQSELDADSQLADLMTYAQEQGYGAISGGVETKYINGVVVTAAALTSPDNTLVALVRSSEPSESYFLAKLESADPLKLLVFDQNGRATVDLGSGDVSSTDAHGSCRYFHCVAAAIYFLMDDPIYGRIVGRACGSCVAGLALGAVTMPVSCPVCIATAVAPALASGWVCSEDPCGWCFSDACGTDDYGEPSCIYGFGSTGIAVIRRVAHYSCSNPHESNSQCVSTDNVETMEECQYDCAPDRKSCAPPPTPPPSTCDPATCERPDQPLGDPRCVFRPDDQEWILERDYDHWECSPVQGGANSTCEQMTITKFEQMCPYGCAADGMSCASAGEVPAAPSDFLALQHPGGTQFEWTDNSDNEDGFRVYFGGRSVGRPSQLITTVGPDTQTVDTDFVRSGTEVCWEIYAYNAAGESAPAWYCLPP